MKLNDCTAVVTGASSGIGLELTRRLLEGGATVYGLSRRKPAGIESPSFTFLEVDLTHREELDKTFDTVLDREETVDLLVNNAGAGLFGPVEEIAPEEWHRLVALNLTAPFLCTRRVVPGMKAAGRGTILNISSIAGIRGFKGGALYCASKFGLEGFSEAIKEELRESGIRVMIVNPGSTDTAFFRNANLEPRKLMDTGALVGIIIDMITLPDDILPDRFVARPL